MQNVLADNVVVDQDTRTKKNKVMTLFLTVTDVVAVPLTFHAFMLG